MARPTISYNDDELKQAQKLMEAEAKRLNAEAAKINYDEEDTPPIEEETKKTKKSSKKSKEVTPSVKIESDEDDNNEDQDEEEVILGEEIELEQPEDNLEDEDNSEDENMPEEKETSKPKDVVKVVSDGKGGKIEVDNTLDDPFANLDESLLGGESSTKTNTVPKNVKNRKDQSKVVEDRGEEVIMNANPSVRQSEIQDKELVSIESAETNEVTIQKDTTTKKKKDENSLISDNGTEKPFDEIAVKDIPDVFDGIDTSGSLADIEIVENTNLIDLADSTSKIFDQPVFQVTALKSGYIAYMSSLTFKDRDIINRSDVDRVTHNRNLFRIIYDKMDHCSFGKPSFEVFMKITAWEDIDTLLFGIYRQTFPGNSDILLTCNHCQRESRVTIDPNNFIVTKSEEATEEIQNLIRELAADPNMKAKDLAKYSQINKVKRIELPHSRIVIDVCNPSLEKFNAITAFFSKNTEESENMQTLISSVIFIDKIYVPNIRLSRSKGKMVYDCVENLPDILKILGRIDTEDEFRLKAKVLVRQDKYSVDYKIRNVVCPACNKVMGEINVDIESLLFLAIAAAVAYRTLPGKQKE